MNPSPNKPRDSNASVVGSGTVVESNVTVSSGCCVVWLHWLKFAVVNVPQNAKPFDVLVLTGMKRIPSLAAPELHSCNKLVTSMDTVPGVGATIVAAAAVT